MEINHAATTKEEDQTPDPQMEKAEDIRAIRMLFDYATISKTPLFQDHTRPKGIKDWLDQKISEQIGRRLKGTQKALDQVYHGKEEYVQAAKSVLMTLYGDKLNKCDEWIRPIYHRLIDRADGFQSLDLILRDTSGLRNPKTRTPNTEKVNTFMERFGGEWVIIRYAGRQEMPAGDNIGEDDKEDVMKGFITITPPKDNEYAPRFSGFVRAPKDALAPKNITERGIVVPYENPDGAYFIMFGFEHGEKEPIYILADMPDECKPTHFKTFVVRRHTEAGLMASKALYVRQEMLPSSLKKVGAGYFNRRHLNGFKETIGLDPAWFLNLAARDGCEAMLLSLAANKL